MKIIGFGSEMKIIYLHRLALNNQYKILFYTERNNTRQNTGSTSYIKNIIYCMNMNVLYGTYYITYYIFIDNP